MPATLPHRTTADTPATHVADHNALHDLYNALYGAVTIFTAAHTLTTDDRVVIMNGAALTATLPDATTVASRVFTVKNINASALTLATAAGNIDGVATQSLAQNVALTVVSDGTNYYLV